MFPWGLPPPLLLVLAILSRLLFGAPAYPAETPRWRRLIGAWVNALIYLALVVVLASGYLRQIFTASPVLFWGTPLPSWGEPDDRLADLFANTHEIAAFVLAGLVVVHIGTRHRQQFRLSGLRQQNAARKEPSAGRRRPGLADERPVRRQDRAASRRPNAPLGLDQILDSVRARLPVGVAPAIRDVGTRAQRRQAGIGDAIYWSGCALALLFLTCALAYHYTRRARKIALAPERYLGGKRGSGLWFLHAGMTFGFLGVFLSFIGVALSISLLIAKTVSQPPGIAITDPTKIIRALDVFVLLMSFLLLLAHFIGVGISVWLRIAVARARFQYQPSTQTGDRQPAASGYHIKTCTYLYCVARNPLL